MARKPGVLPNTFTASLRPRAVAASPVPLAYSMILGTPVYLGGNDVHGDCVTVAAFNACAITDMRRGIVRPIDNIAPFELYEELGGMPADIGLDPAVLIKRWMAAPISGYLLKNIWALALDDMDGQQETIAQTGFVYYTAALDAAQMQQNDWSCFPGSPLDGDHAFLGTGFVGSRFADETWGEDQWFERDFIKAQGINAWRLELQVADG